MAAQRPPILAAPTGGCAIDLLSGLAYDLEDSTKSAMRGVLQKRRFQSAKAAIPAKF